MAIESPTAEESVESCLLNSPYRTLAVRHKRSATFPPSVAELLIMAAFATIVKNLFAQPTTVKAVAEQIRRALKPK